AVLHKNLTTHRKCNGNRRIDFHRIAVQHGRFIAPLFYSIQSRLHQERVTGDHFELRYLAVLIDDRVKDDAALNAGLPRQGGVERASLREDRRSRYVTALLDARRSSGLRWWRSHCCDHTLPGNAAKHATGDTG